MAEAVLTEINVLELELIQSVQTAIKAFEARNPGTTVDSLTYNFKTGGTIKYEASLKNTSSPQSTL